MALIDFRDTHWMAAAHPGSYKTTTAAFIKMHQAGIPIKSIKLFPHDLVVIVLKDEGKEVFRRFYPAKLTLYKYLWDNVSSVDKTALRKHLKRCVDVRDQFKKNLCSEEVRIWYMALILGAADES